MAASPQTWLEIFGAAAHHEGTITEICRRYGVSRQSFYVHLRRLREEGVEGLAERSRRPVRSPGRVSRELEQRVVQLRQEQPWMGARAIRRALLAEGHPKAPAVSTIGHIIRRNRLPPRCFNDTGHTDLPVEAALPSPDRPAPTRILQNGAAPHGCAVAAQDDEATIS